MNIRLKSIAILCALATVTGVALDATASYSPVCITVQPGKGWNWVANQFNPTITGTAREAFVWRIWAYEDNNAVLTAGEQVCIDPSDPALMPTTTTTTRPTTTTTTTTTIRPTTTTTTVRPTTTTSLPTTSLGNDRWLFVGDSNSAISMNSSVAAAVHAADPSRNPVIENVSLGGASAWSWNQSCCPTFSTVLANSNAHFVVLAVGTNDYQPDFDSHYEALILRTIAAGRVPVLLHIPWTNGYEPAKEALINATIDRMLAKYPVAIPGPDLYAATVNQPSLFRAPLDVHYSPAGEAVFRQAWVSAILTADD